MTIGKTNDKWKGKVREKQTNRELKQDIRYRSTCVRRKKKGDFVHLNFL